MKMIFSHKEVCSWFCDKLPAKDGNPKDERHFVFQMSEHSKLSDLLYNNKWLSSARHLEGILKTHALDELLHTCDMLMVDEKVATSQKILLVQRAFRKNDIWKGYNCYVNLLLKTV